MKKIFIALHGVQIDKSHELQDLRSHFDIFDQIPELKDIALVGLSRYAVLAHYDLGFAPALDEAGTAVELATKVISLILPRIPLEARPKKMR